MKININDILQEFKKVTVSSNKLGECCKTFIKQEGRDKISGTVKQLRFFCDTLEKVLSTEKVDVEKIKEVEGEDDTRGR